MCCVAEYFASELLCIEEFRFILEEILGITVRSPSTLPIVAVKVAVVLSVD